MALPDDFPDGWEIAGWEDGSGGWHNTEQGDSHPFEYQLAESDWIVVHDVATDEYYSIMGGVEDWEGLYDIIGDLEEEYG